MGTSTVIVFLTVIGLLIELRLFKKVKSSVGTVPSFNKPPAAPAPICDPGAY
jgi:hypothetical protein